MKNKALIVYKGSFLSKVKTFFKNLFCNNNQNNNETQTVYEAERNIEINRNENEFFNQIKIDTTELKKDLDRKAFLQKIDGDAEMLKMLSIDRLEKLDKYYDRIIKQNEEKIEKLKNLG